MTLSYRTSVKGTLLSTGEDTRNRILAALPSSAAEIARQFGIPKSTARDVLRKLLALGVVRVGEKRIVGKNVEFIYVQLTTVVISPAAKLVPKSLTGLQKPQPHNITPKVHKMVSKDPRNIWARPVYAPPKWEPPRRAQVTVSQTGSTST